MWTKCPVKLFSAMKICPMPCGRRLSHIGMIVERFLFKTKKSSQTISLHIEDITWPRGDTNFIFECWKYLFQHEKVKFVSPSGHVMFCLLHSLSKQQNSPIKVVTYRKFVSSSRKSPVTVPSSNLEATLWKKFQKNRPRAWAGSSLVIGKSC